MFSNFQNNENSNPNKSYTYNFSRIHAYMNNDRLIRTGWFLFIISIIITLFILAKSILIPFLLSAFITYLLYPLVWKIEKRGVHRGISIILVLMVVTIIIGGLTLVLSIKLSI